MYFPLIAGRVVHHRKICNIDAITVDDVVQRGPHGLRKRHGSASKHKSFPA